MITREDVEKRTKMLSSIPLTAGMSGLSGLFALGQAMHGKPVNAAMLGVSGLATAALAAAEYNKAQSISPVTVADSQAIGLKPATFMLTSMPAAIGTGEGVRSLVDLWRTKELMTRKSVPGLALAAAGILGGVAAGRFNEYLSDRINDSTFNRLNNVEVGDGEKQATMTREELIEKTASAMIDQLYADGVIDENGIAKEAGINLGAMKTMAVNAYKTAAPVVANAAKRVGASVGRLTPNQKIGVAALGGVAAGSVLSGHNKQASSTDMVGMKKVDGPVRKRDLFAASLDGGNRSAMEGTAVGAASAGVGAGVGAGIAKAFGKSGRTGAAIGAMTAGVAGLTAGSVHGQYQGMANSLNRRIASKKS